jgi:hypothetical protein
MMNFALGILFAVFMIFFIAQMVEHQKAKKPLLCGILPMTWKQFFTWLFFGAWFLFLAHLLESPPVYLPTVNTIGL